MQQSVKSIYFFQMGLQIPETNFAYLPYSVGCIWAYAQSKINPSTYRAKDFFYKKEPINKLLERIENPSIAAFSTYVWNSNYNLSLAKKIKDKYPNTLVVFGGPEVPNNPKNYLQQNPFIDLVVHNEGEQTFLSILNNYPWKNLESIQGVSFVENGEYCYTGSSPRIKDVHLLPSPYLTGIFDNYVKELKANNNWEINATLETNRGCPYRCTFCDWGSLTYQKIYKIDLQRIKAEIEWMGRHEIDLINNADANFGIFPKRDNQITEYLIETNQKYGYPRLFETNWAKNSGKVILDIAKRLHTQGILRRFTIALQSRNTETLKSINRRNISDDSFDETLEEAKQNNIPVTTELILGLPNESPESWKEGVCELLEKEIWVDAYPLSCLVNSELNDLNYKEKHGIDTKELRLPYSQHCAEFQETVISTKHISKSRMQQLWLFNWIAIGFHYHGFTFFISRFLRSKFSIPFFDFYSILFEVILSEETPLNKHLREFKKFASEYQFQEFYPGIRTDWIEVAGISHREEFQLVYRRVVTNLISKYTENTNGIELIEPLINYQDALTYKPRRIYPFETEIPGDHLYHLGEINVLRDRIYKVTVDHKGMGKFKQYGKFMGMHRKRLPWKCELKYL